jgi:hypothetical protein
MMWIKSSSNEPRMELQDMFDLEDKDESVLSKAFLVSYMGGRIFLNRSSSTQELTPYLIILVDLP